MFVPVILAVVLGSAQATAQPAPPQQPAPATVQTTADKPWPPEGVTRTGKGIVTPRVIKEVKPSYPTPKPEKSQAFVDLEAVVQADGTVGEVRVKPSPSRDAAFEEAAVKAVKKWRFAPGTKDGVPVPVLVEIQLSFAAR